jgi:translation initiation factor 4E
VTHLLETPWTFWVSEHHQGGRGKHLSKEAYIRDVAKLCTISSVEEFWSFWNQTSRPEDMRIGSNLYLFRVGLKPMWEELPNGSTWSIKIQKSTNYDMREAWQRLFLLSIGENLETTQLAGCSVSSRPNHYVMTIWLEVSPSAESQMLILEKLKSVLQLPVDTIMEYKDNCMSLVDGSTTAHSKRYSITS